MKLAPNSSRFGLNGDFGAPGQSTLKIGVARQATRSLNRSSDLADVGNLRRVPVHQVLAARLAQVDEAHAEIARRHLARVAEVLRDLVGQDGEVERDGGAARSHASTSHRGGAEPGQNGAS